MWRINGRSYSQTGKNMDKVLLSGFAVTVLAVILPILLRLIGVDVPLDFLADGAVTLGEALGFVGAILLAISQSVRRAARKALKKDD